MAPRTTPTPLVFGGAAVRSGGRFSETQDVVKLFHTLRESGITHIDTAQLYGDSETVLGAAGIAAQGFTVDTKVPGGFLPGSGTLEPSKLIADARRSRELLGVPKLDVFYIHCPEPSNGVPLADTLAAVNQLHAEGLFSRLGLSNFSAAEVEEVHAIASSRGWVVPTVYQGNYSAFARRAETELLPVLRRLGLSFYAYSPLAGGFLARRSQDQLFGKEGGRFSKEGGFKLYQGLYSERPKLVAALSRWAETADRAGCESPAELGYRWIAWNSALEAALGDKVIFGASRVEQVQQVVQWVAKGPLSDDVVKVIDELWQEIKDEAPLDNYHK